MSGEVERAENNVPEAYSVTDYFKKPNFLISAKYRSSLLENKILVESLSNLAVLKNCREDPNNGILYSDIYASELIEALGVNKGSFYQKLDPIAKKMAGRVVGITNPDTQEFEYISIISHAYYKKGVLTIGYNPLIKERLVNLKDDFTPQSKLLMLSFENVYAFRLYELLRSKAFFPKWRAGGNTVGKSDLFEIEYGLAELRFELGVADADEPKVREILGNSVNPNYELALERCSKQVFENWTEFRRNVLDVAIKEINNSKFTDIQVEYRVKKAGVGAKVRGVVFTVRRDNVTAKNEQAGQKKLSEKEMDDILDAISEIIDAPLKLKDIRAVAEAAGYDVEKVKKANKIMGQYGKNHDIHNVTGFLIDAIKGEKELVVKNKEEKKNSNVQRKYKSKNRFNQFEQREYDFEELERMLLSE